MKRKLLGRTGLTVPGLCLGSMTWGHQNTQEEAFAQMDHALAHGIDFIDTAEVYPTVPLKAETQGDTETIIGNWVAARQNRDRVILATKVAGTHIDWIQNGIPVCPEKIRNSVDGSLKRLQTDYVDLYQIHWPNRGHYHFRRNWDYDPSQQPRDVTQDIADTLGELGRQVEAGKIRAIGLSNETCWGTMQFLKIAEDQGLPRVASVQNEYSLLYRTFDLDMAEMSHHEDVGLLAYTPTAGGILSGKYSDGAAPQGSRGDRQPEIGGRRTEAAIKLADRYAALARDHGMTPVQMAIAFCLSRPFMTSVILGATHLDQLKEAMTGADVTLSEDALEAITALHKERQLVY
ncbi:aldo/keto reductase [Halovulum sp. GXIMD14793]